MLCGGRKCSSMTRQLACRPRWRCVTVTSRTSSSAARPICSSETLLSGWSASCSVCVVSFNSTVICTLLQLYNFFVRFYASFYSSYDCRFSLFFVCRLSAVAVGQAYRFHNAVSKEIVTAELSGRLGLAFLSLNHQNQSDEGLAAENVFKKFYEMFVICDE